MKKNIIVTGAAGFLGSHIAARHLDSGDNVIGIDDHSTSLGPSSKHVNELKCKGMRLIEARIELVETWLSRHLPNNVDTIYNFACPASPPRYQKMPIKTMVTCFQGTKNVLDFAHQRSAIVVHASTSEVYGDPQVSPQNESYKGCVNTWGPRANYDEGKRVAEALCYEYKRLGTDVRVARIFNTYGPHMDPDDGRVVTNFITQALRHRTLTVFDGLQTRSFCYVSDLVDGIMSLSQSHCGFSTPINIGNDKEMTVLQLAHKIIELTQSSSEVQILKLPQDDPHQRKPDLTLAKKLLGYQPKVSLEEGLTRTINYFSAAERWAGSWLSTDDLDELARGTSQR